MPSTDREFAFDVTLNAVARVKAKSEKEALRKLHEVVDAVDLSGTPGTVDNDVTMTEGSIGNSDPILFEIDGEPPPFPSEAHYIAAARDNGWLPGDEDTAEQFCKDMEIDASSYDPREARDV
jgi:hypothetical protein